MRKLLLLLSLWSVAATASDFPIIIDPVVNATPPGAKVTAGYFTMVNETEKDIIINGAYSPTISKVELHLSKVENDVASMEKQDSLTLEAGATLEFKHGSYHLMLMELSEPLNENDTVDIILATSIGDMLIEMPIRKAGMHANADMHEKEHMQDDGDMAKKDKAKMALDNHDEMKKDGDKHADKTKIVH